MVLTSAELRIDEPQLRVADTDGRAALNVVIGLDAVRARARLVNLRPAGLHASALAEASAPPPGPGRQTLPPVLPVMVSLMTGPWTSGLVLCVRRCSR
jgi:hypothetical protein